MSPAGIANHDRQRIEHRCRCDLCTNSGGGRSATLFITGNGFGSPQQVSLDGNGNAAADIAVSQGVQKDPQRRFLYTISIINGGPALATGIIPSDPIPAGTKFVSVAASQGSCLTPAPGGIGTMTCKLGNLGSNAQASVALLVDVTATGQTTITNNVSVTTTSPDPTPPTMP